MLIFFIFAQNRDCGYTSTHNLCFGAKIRKIGIPLCTPVLLYKGGLKGLYISRTFFPDVYSNCSILFSKREPHLDIPHCFSLPWRGSSGYRGTTDNGSYQFPS